MPSLCFGTYSHNNGGYYIENNTQDEIIAHSCSQVHYKHYLPEPHCRETAGQVSPMTNHSNACGKHRDC